MPTNRLIHEKSPYLLQHARNPVDWYAWGEEAFAKARAADKPIFLSIGYSTCHWCHVMERESFESDAIAALLNEHFVPVKVDREERPDVDRIYMMFVQATTGSGGWPMSVWLTPELKPFFGGTYFPPDNRYGRPGFAALLEYIARIWVEERLKINESGEDIVEQLARHSEVRAAEVAPLDEGVLESGFLAFRRNFDTRLGGFGGAPKFPRPVVHNFLFRYWKRTGEEEARDMVLRTLDEMAKGGMYDQVGGGFHRYSVDEKWFVPHFEKMLYDQGQLAQSYVEAYQVTGEARYAEVARDILEYVLRDLRHPDGAFYSAEDADSVIDPAHPHEKGEGAFYIWTQAEIEEVLGPEGGWFSRAYGVKPEGNVLHDPQQEFTGRNILYQAAETGVPAEKLAAAKAKLLAARSRRIRPHLDDKVLTSWNGLMISAFCKAAQAFGEERYALAARQAADFLLSRMWDGTTLKRRFREGHAAIDGFLDDYAYLLLALLDLYETVFEDRYREAAQALARRMVELFEDRAGGAFFSSAEGAADLILRMKEDYDGAEPSGNSMAVLGLLRLWAMTGETAFRDAADRALRAFAPRMKAGAMGLPQMLAAYGWSLGSPKQIVLSQAHPGMLRAIRSRFLPHSVVTVERAEGPAIAKVCENFACLMPVDNVEDLVKLLE